MATNLLTWFNMLAVAVGAAEVNLEELRNSLQSEIDEKSSTWLDLGRMQMLHLFGNTEELHAAMNQCFRLFGPKAGERTNTADA